VAGNFPDFVLLFNEGWLSKNSAPPFKAVFFFLLEKFKNNSC
jgi:hypothetical protein